MDCEERQHSRSSCLLLASLQGNCNWPLGMWPQSVFFFMLVIDDFVIHTWSNGPCCTSLSCLLGTTVKIDDTPIFIIGVLSFRHYGRLLAGLPSDQPPSQPQILRLKLVFWVKICHTCLCSLLPKRQHSFVVSHEEELSYINILKFVLEL